MEETENKDTTPFNKEDELITLDNEQGLKVKARVWGGCEYKKKFYAGVYFTEDPELAGKGIAIYEVMQDPRDGRSAIFIPVHDEELETIIFNKL